MLSCSFQEGDWLSKPNNEMLSWQHFNWSDPSGCVWILSQNHMWDSTGFLFWSFLSKYTHDYFLQLEFSETKYLILIMYIMHLFFKWVYIFLINMFKLIGLIRTLSIGCVGESWKEWFHLSLISFVISEFDKVMFIIISWNFMMKNNILYMFFTLKLKKNCVNNKCKERIFWENICKMFWRLLVYKSILLAGNKIVLIDLVNKQAVSYSLA